MPLSRMDAQAVRERLGANVRRHRQRAEMSQAELAEAAGLHRTAIGLIENGYRMMRADTLLTLADALEVDPAVLLDIRD
jgi:transcriptional regulator with XRE-family HTH domain